MARAGWLNENEYRDYPFLTQTDVADLPSELIVDFGAIMDVDSGYADDTHYVYLSEIRREGDLLYFEFRNTSPDADEALVFVRDIADEEFTMDWEESGSLGSSSSVTSRGGCDEAKWSGFLVTGKFDAILDVLTSNGTITFSPADWVVEPAQVQNLSGTYLRSINLANTARTLAEPGGSCGSAGNDDGQAIVQARCLQGDRSFKEGYNCTILQDDRNRTLIIGGARGAGAGEPCEEVPLYEGEVGPEGPFLTGGPTCGEILKTINGKGGRQLRINAGPGFRVFTDPADPHTLIVARRLDDFATCAGGDA